MRWKNSRSGLLAACILFLGTAGCARVGNVAIATPVGSLSFGRGGFQADLNIPIGNRGQFRVNAGRPPGNAPLAGDRIADLQPVQPVLPG